MEQLERRRLIVEEGPNQGAAYVLEDAICTLGRATDNTITINDPRISRHHAQIQFSPGGGQVEDLGSTNGTWLNDEQVSGPAFVSPGDLIRLADCITLRFEVEGVRPEEARTMAISPASTAATVGSGAPPYYATDDDSFPPPSDELWEEETPAGEVASPGRARKRPRWMVTLIVLLLILLCLCVGVAAYLWFAPVEFWEQLFEFLGIQLPENLPSIGML